MPLLLRDVHYVSRPGTCVDADVYEDGAAPDAVNLAIPVTRENECALDLRVHGEPPPPVLVKHEVLYSALGEVGTWHTVADCPRRCGA